MNNRERLNAVLHYEDYDRMPVVHFGYWPETLDKWCREGYLDPGEITCITDGSPNEAAVSKKLGFDFNYYNNYHDKYGGELLFPPFERRIIEEMPGGMKKVINGNGVTILVKEGINSISPEIDHLLKDRRSWEEHFLPRLQYTEDRLDMEELERIAGDPDRQGPLGLSCKSLAGMIRNWMGIEGLSYIYSDDEQLFDEIIDTVGSLCFRLAEKALSFGAAFDFAHYWEDICFKNGPLISPAVFGKKVGPHYMKISELVKKYGIDIVSVDCDGWIDSLIPVWFENGVNTMFPIEVGTWGGSIKPWREKYGRELRGIGGMNKHVFAEDYAAVDAEIERLKPLVELGGYIPCPDHRIPPSAKWENVQYYCDRMRRIF